MSKRKHPKQIELGKVILCDLTGDVNQEMVRKVYRFDARLRTAEKNVIGLLRISSDGGDTDSALMIHELLRMSPVPIVTLGIGAVLSSATIIFAAGRKRILTPLTRIHLHALTTTGTALLVHEIADMLTTVRERTAANVAVINEATGRPTEEVLTDLREGRVLTGRAAVRYGLATAVECAPQFEIVAAVE